MRIPWSPAVALVLTAALSSGVPVPRAVPVTEEAGAACTEAGRSGPCSALPCPAGRRPDPARRTARSGSAAGCNLCLLCVCGIGVLAPGVVLAPPAESGSLGLEKAAALRAVEHQPPLPPPKRA